MGNPKYVGVSNLETHLEVRLPLLEKGDSVSVKPAIKGIEGYRQIGRRRKIVGYLWGDDCGLIAGGNGKSSLYGYVERTSRPVILDAKCYGCIISHWHVISQWYSAAIQSHRDDLNKSPLCQLQRVFGDFGTRFSGVGGYVSSGGVILGGFRGRFGNAKLTLHRIDLLPH